MVSPFERYMAYSPVNPVKGTSSGSIWGNLVKKRENFNFKATLLGNYTLEVDKVLPDGGSGYPLQNGICLIARSTL